MAKKRAPVTRRAARPSKTVEAPTNPFERVKNKSRFDVLGRKQKGDVRDAGKLRSAATEKRKSTLLVEYKSLKKQNAFLDRRFGEQDPTLTEEERSLARLQRQRVLEAAAGKFALPLHEEEEGEGGGRRGGRGASPATLTHGGTSLAELGWGARAGIAGEADDDDDEPDFARALQEELQFGGGVAKPGPGGEEGEEGEEGDRAPARRRTHAEIMAEVIAKSKAYRAERAAQKDDDAAETERLDEGLRELRKAGVLAGMLAPKGKRGPAGEPTEDELAFDAAERELLRAARGGVADRVPSAEEAEARAAEVEERARRGAARRMRAGPGGDFLELEGEDGAPLGGYAARRAKRRREEAEEGDTESGGEDGDGWGAGDDEDDGRGSDGSDAEASALRLTRRGAASAEALGGEDDFVAGEGGDEEGDAAADPASALELRRRARAAGSHPLQGSFRDAALRLLAKHDAKAKAKLDRMDAERREEGSESGSGSEDDDESGSGSEDDDESGSGSEDDSEGGSGSGSEDEDEEEDEAAAEAAVEAATEAVAAPSRHPTPSAAGGTKGKTASPELPASYKAFAAMAEGLSPAALDELLWRLREAHAPELRAERRKGAQQLFGCVASHLASLAKSESRSAAACQRALVPHLVALAALAPFYAATLAKARLEKIASRTRHARRTGLDEGDGAGAPGVAPGATPWPAPGELALLAAFTQVFSMTDRRHPVATPLAMLCAEVLERGPVRTPRHVATGLFVASAGARGAVAAGRWQPSSFRFAARVLRDLGRPRGKVAWRSGYGSAEGGADGRGPERSPPTDAPPSLRLSRLLTPRAWALLADAEVFPEGALAAAAAGLLLACAETLRGVEGAPEALAPAVAALARAAAAAEAAGEPHAAALAEALATLRGLVSSAAAARRPLLGAASSAPAQARTFNPRFEEGFAPGRDLDPDRERAERKRLQRELRREERGAARELRRDATFMAQVRDQEKAKTQAGLERSQRKAISFLQQQQADFNSGGQKGMWKKKKR